MNGRKRERDGERERVRIWRGGEIKVDRESCRERKRERAGKKDRGSERLTASEMHSLTDS